MESKNRLKCSEKPNNYVKKSFIIKLKNLTTSEIAELQRNVVQNAKVVNS